MPKILLTSYIPPVFPNWPDTGPAEWETVTAGMPDTTWVKFQVLPCQHNDHLLWQSHAHWVVLEVPSEECVEVDGFVQFSRGQVLFNGPPRDAHAFLRNQGRAAPFSLDRVRVGHDWENVSLGERGIAGQDAEARVGEHGVAYASNGLAPGIKELRFQRTEMPNRAISDAPGLVAG